MAIKGVSKFVTADYSYNGSAVSYSNGTVNQKLVSYSSEIEAAEANNLYADNGISETDAGTFASGTLTVGTDDLSQDTSKALLTIKEVNVQIGDTPGKTIKSLVFDDTTKGKEKGVGVIELHQVNGVDMYRALVFLRVRFNVPANSATTKGESVEWQTPELTASILRSDLVDNTNGVHPWKQEGDCESEEEALAFIKKILNITDEPLEDGDGE